MTFKTLVYLRNLAQKELLKEKKVLEKIKDKKERELAKLDSDWNTDEGIEELRKWINASYDRVNKLEHIIEEIDNAELK